MPGQMPRVNDRIKYNQSYINDASCAGARRLRREMRGTLLNIVKGGKAAHVIWDGNSFESTVYMRDIELAND